MRTDLDPAGFAALLTAPGLQAVSFDVFDTALVRTFARANDLFAELGRLMISREFIRMTPEHFSHLRVQAEAQARRDRADTEPRLAEIYQVLAIQLGWSLDQRLVAEEWEIALEQESMRAVPRVRCWIEAARAAGQRIAFVSDMYLSVSVIRAMLVDAKLARPEDTILVSCEYRVTKAEGGLFDQLTQTLGLPAKAILHIGDNLRSDGVVPQRKGFRTLGVVETRLGFFEERLLAYQHDTGGLSGRLAATSRLARLACSPDNREPALIEIGAGLLGPWLACFALWIFARAQRAGITRLYFISRDGQVMREIALAVQSRWAPAAGIECRYLHGSRIAWHHAAMTDFGPHQLAWLLNPQPRVNLEILAGRLGVTAKQLTGIFADTAVESHVTESVWDSAALEHVAVVLREKSAEILAWPEVSARRDLAGRYLQQEGLLRDTTWAVVELGWSGSMMVSLHEALGRPPGLTAYYLNLSSRCPALPAAVHLESFAINPNDVSGHLGQGLRLAEMIEVLTAADHATVLGYGEKDGSITPLLKTDSPSLWPHPALAALREGARQFVALMPAEVMTQLADQLSAAATARIVVHQLMLVLTDFMRTPPPELARAFMACRFTEDPADHDQRGFVQPLSFWPVLWSGWPTERELWAQGTLACTPPVVTALVSGGLPAAAAQLWRGLLRRLSPAS